MGLFSPNSIIKELTSLSDEYRAAFHKAPRSFVVSTVDYRRLLAEFRAEKRLMNTMSFDGNGAVKTALGFFDGMDCIPVFPEQNVRPRRIFVLNRLPWE